MASPGNETVFNRSFWKPRKLQEGEMTDDRKTRQRDGLFSKRFRVAEGIKEIT